VSLLPSLLATADPCRTTSNPLLTSEFYSKLAVLLRICVPSVRSKETSILLALLGVAFLKSMLVVKAVQTVGSTARALVGGKLFRFTAGVLRTALLSVPVTLAAGSLKYLSSLLALHFRKRITHHCHEQYLNDTTFIKAANPHSHIDHFDSRISQDVENFTQSVSDLYLNASVTGAELIVFSNTLSQALGVQGPMYLLFYYVLTGLVLRSLAPQYLHYFRKQGQAECDLRCTHARLAAHSTEIAYFGSLERERNIVEKLFSQIFTNARKIFRVQAIISLTDQWLAKHGATITGFAVIAFALFQKKGPRALSPRSVAIRTQFFVTNTRLVTYLAESFSQAVMTYRKAQMLVPATKRLFQLVDILRILNLGTSSAVKAEKNIELKDVNIVADDGSFLVENLTMEVREGEGLIVGGSSRAGKTALFKALGGVHPIHSGTMATPEGRNVLYLPQQPYLPVVNLQSVLIYPHTVDEMAAKGMTNAHLEEFLRIAGVKYLLEREPDGWDMVHEWAQVLTSSEQQRLALARVLYHSPRFVVLDDALSALTPNFVGQVYQALKQHSITPITVATHKDLAWTHHVNGLFFHGDRLEVRRLTKEETAPPQSY